jgi:hypothetical protein
LVTKVSGVNKLNLGRPLASSKAGPNISPAGLGLFLDARAWANLGLQNPLYNFLRVWDRHDMVTTIESMSRDLEFFVKDLPKILSDPFYGALVHGRVIKSSQGKGGHVKEYDPSVPLVTGKISFVFEGGGKVRTIAIGDVLTQWVLKPIHDGIFALLRV